MNPTLRMEAREVASLKPNPRNPRTHSKKQTRQIANSIEEFGTTNPPLIDEHGVLIAGHGRVEAAKSLGMTLMPVMVISGLSEQQKRRLMLADNRIAANSGWDREKLAFELHDLILEEADLTITGFEAAEIDQILLDFEQDPADPADAHPPLPENPVSKGGDLWILGNHRLLCGDAREVPDLELLCGGERAAMAFLDVPYNVKVAKIVGRGKFKHREFAMASGEMSPTEFRAFLEAGLGNAAKFSMDGAVHYVCIDWRHVDDVKSVGESLYGEMLNLVAWVKTAPGQGSFYRSQHELIGVFRVGRAAHVNNIQLGKHGRNRSNVWHYAGVNTFGKGRLDDLSCHPTVKPVAMVADAIKDCTRRGDVVLDSFAGSGTTTLACERVGRRARCVEFEPGYVDVAIRRWQAFTGRDAFHAGTGRNFDEIASVATAEACDG